MQEDDVGIVEEYSGEYKIFDQTARITIICMTSMGFLKA
jgi:hypothetical protein